jgi:hypothetical protein
VIRLAASPGEAAPQQVCALWTDLLARLLLAAVASKQTQTHLQLRALGVRRTGTVASNLARELAEAQRMAASAGVQVQLLALQRRVGELAQPEALLEHLRGLTAAYQRIQLHAGLPPGGPLLRWLDGRQRVHRVQIGAIEQLTGPLQQAGRSPAPASPAAARPARS